MDYNILVPSSCYICTCHYITHYSDFHKSLSTFDMHYSLILINLIVFKQYSSENSYYSCHYSSKGLGLSLLDVFYQNIFSYEADQLYNAKIGTDKIIPKIPPISSPAKRANIIMSGCICRLFPTINGDKIFPSKNCIAKTMITVTMIILTEIVEAIMTAGTAPMTGPK